MYLTPRINICLVFALLLLGLGCAENPGDTKFRDTFAAQYPAEMEKMSGLFNSMNNALGYFAAYDFLKQTDNAELQQEALNNLINISNRRSIGLITNEIVVVDFSWKSQGNNSYKLNLLLQTSKPLPDDYHVFLYANFDFKHVDKLPPQYQNRKSLDWKLKPGNYISAENGKQYLMITDDIAAADIPFDLQTGIFRKTDKWVKIGNLVPLGWHYDFNGL